MSLNVVRGLGYRVHGDLVGAVRATAGQGSNGAQAEATGKAKGEKARSQAQSSEATVGEECRLLPGRTARSEMR